MSDLTSKKAGARPVSSMVNRLQAELSKGPYAAEAARPPPLPEHEVRIEDPDDFADHAIDMDGFGDPIAPEETPAAPVSDDRYVITQRFVAVSQPARRGWIGIACAIAAVAGCAAFLWSQRSAHPITTADSAVAKDGSPMRAARPTTVAEVTAPASAASAPGTAVHDSPAAPVVTGSVPRPLTDEINALPAESPAPAPSRGSPPSGGTRNRPSPSPSGRRTAPPNEVVDPLFTDQPGY
jgi:hypothetical protein